MIKDIAKVAAALTAGEITREVIVNQFGDSFLSEVLAFGGGSIVGGLAADLIGGLLGDDDDDSDDDESLFGF